MDIEEVKVEKERFCKAVAKEARDFEAKTGQHLIDVTVYIAQLETSDQPRVWSCNAKVII